MTLGEMTPLRRLCTERGMSRQKAAQEAGLSRQTLYNIEAGIAPSAVTLFKLAQVFGMTSDVLAAALNLDPETGRIAA